MTPPSRWPLGLADAPSFSIFFFHPATLALLYFGPLQRINPRVIFIFSEGGRARFVAAPRIFQWRRTNGHRFFPRHGNSAAICLSAGNSWPYVLSRYRGIEHGTLFKVRAAPTTSHFSSSPPLGTIALNERGGWRRSDVRSLSL